MTPMEDDGWTPDHGYLQAHLCAFGSGGLISLPVVYCRHFKDGSSFGVCSVARFHLIFGTVFLA